MSAVPPLPPPHLQPLEAASSTRTYNQNGGPARPLPHIQDLLAQAETQVDPNNSISRLLERTTTALKQANSYFDFGRPEYAWVEYAVAQTIVANVIPRHKDAPELKAEKGRLSAVYGDCIRRINLDQDRFDRIKELIETDNRRSGVTPRSQLQTNGRSTRNSHSTFLDSPSPSPSRSPSSSQRNSVAGTMTRDEPSNVDPLSERFARLRTVRTSEDRQTSKNIPESISRRTTSTSQSQNPRNSQIPPVKASISKDLPKAPSPTYSPARTAQDTNGFPQHQRSTEPVSRSVGYTSTTTSTSTTPYQPYRPLNNGYSTIAEKNISTNRQSTASRRRRYSENMPQETEIDADRLYDYLRTFNVLLIDVRSREEYDAGHIWSQTIICVEPEALRPSQSAEDLLDSLVLSPELEIRLFDCRDEFDLVVYFNQSTQSSDLWGKRQYRDGEEVALRRLHDTLSNFNQEKPLQWPPLLLNGGMDAWIDLLGKHALQTSNTAVNKSKGVKVARPIARRPPASSSARLNVQKKRYREYNPLAPEEEQKWRERARRESVARDAPPLMEEVEDNQTASPEEIDNNDQGYEDFRRRYPDVESVERQTMQSKPPERPTPEHAQIPQYPAPPIPSVPSRPPPAAARPSYSGVSERVPSQTSTTPKSAHLAPYIPPKLKRLPRTGLHNFGVTCYMNATIQCLSATVPLTAFFFEGKYKKSVQQENWKGSKGLMPELYNTLLQNLWRSNDADTIRPTNFRKFCARLNREWGLDRQQDAKEFLEFLIDTLHEDLNVAWARNPLKPLTEEQETAREQTAPFYAAKLEWDRYLHRDHSELTELFAGQHISRLRCTTCGHSSTTYEAFYSISVEIPTPKSKNQGVNIDDCLRSYCSAEMLSGDEVWRCPKCKVEREATKRITITRAPVFLVIHFKRFSAGHSERARKVHTPVDFPLHGLDLKPYMLPTPDSRTMESIERRYGPRAPEAPPSMTPPYHYDAYAVMRHLGSTMTSGHYISLVEDKARGCWREYNDDRVTDFRPDQLAPSKRLQNEQAYIVFYQRKES